MNNEVKIILGITTDKIDSKKLTFSMEKIDFMGLDFVPKLLSRLEAMHLVHDSYYSDKVVTNDGRSCYMFGVQLAHATCKADVINTIGEYTVEYYKSLNKPNDDKPVDNAEQKTKPNVDPTDNTKQHIVDMIKSIVDEKPKSRKEVAVEEFFGDLDDDAPSYMKNFNMCPNNVLDILSEIYAGVYRDLIYHSLLLKGRDKGNKYIQIKQHIAELNELLETTKNEIKLVGEYSKDCGECPIRVSCTSQQLFGGR